MGGCGAGKGAVRCLTAALLLAALPGGIRAEYVMAPIRFWGDITYQSRLEDYRVGEDQWENLLTLNLRGDSYIWQPWFMQVGGGLGLTFDHLQRETTGTSTGDIVTGDGQLRFLPMSRFPFEARYRRTDSRVTGEALGSLPYTNTRYGISQKYRSPEGSFVMQGSWDKNIQTMQGQGDDVSDIYTFMAGKSYSTNKFTFDARREAARRRAASTNYRNDNMVLRHTYRPNGAFSLENLISYLELDDQVSAYANLTRQVQMTSNAFWRPANPKLTGNLGLRYFVNHLETAGRLADTDSVNAYGGINYNLTPYLRLRGNLTAKSARANGERSDVSTQTGTVSYNPAFVPLGRYSYRWYGTAGLTNRVEKDFGGQHFNLTLGHNLQRAFPLRPREEFSFQVSQSINGDYDSVYASRNRLNHSVAFTWRKGKGLGQAYMRLLASDARTVGDGGPREVYQLINYQFNGTYSFGPWSALTGNLTVNANKNITAATTYDGFATTASGSLVYRHLRAFDIPRLQFYSDLRISNQLETPGNVFTQKQESTVWVNRFDYVLGRLSLRLSLRMAEINRNRYNVLMFQARRYFGN